MIFKLPSNPKAAFDVIAKISEKTGVYLFLDKNKKPIYVGETEDIKNDILEKFIKNNSPFLAELKKNDDISIAYSIIKNQNERSKLKSYLQNIYKISTISQTSPW